MRPPGLLSLIVGAALGSCPKASSSFSSCALEESDSCFVDKGGFSKFRPFGGSLDVVDDFRNWLGIWGAWLAAAPSPTDRAVVPLADSSWVGAGMSTTETGLDLRIVRIVGFPRFPILAFRTSLVSSSWKPGERWPSSESMSYAPRISDSAGPDPQLGMARLDATEHFVNRGWASSSGMGETDDRRARGGRREFSGATRPAVRCLGSS